MSDDLNKLKLNDDSLFNEKDINNNDIKNDIKKIDSLENSDGLINKIDLVENSGDLINKNDLLGKNDDLIINNSEDFNATFFDKFEKTKKDLKKQTKYENKNSKRALFNNFKNLSLTNKLNNLVFLKFSWITFASLSVLFIVYSSVVLFYLSSFFSGAPDASQWSYVNVNLPLTQTSIITSCIILSLVILPYPFLISTWFVGINKIYKNEKFFIMNFIFLIISFLCILILIGTSSPIFSFVANFKPII